MLKVKDISKSFRNQKVLDEISFFLEKGKILGVLGVNGVGKTTLLKILALLFQPDQGEVFVNGENAIHKPQLVRPLIGYVPQEIALYGDLSVADNLLCWSRKRSLSNGNPIYSEIAEALEIQGLKKKKVRRLSGGMKRRVNLAVTLMNNPEILIMDEPLVGVDIVQRQIILNYLQSLSSRGVTQVITSHYPIEIIPFVDEVIVLVNGKIKLHENSQVLIKYGQNQNINLDKVIFNMIHNKGVL